MFNWFKKKEAPKPSEPPQLKRVAYLKTITPRNQLTAEITFIDDTTQTLYFFDEIEKCTQHLNLLPDYHYYFQYFDNKYNVTIEYNNVKLIATNKYHELSNFGNNGQVTYEKHGRTYVINSSIIKSTNLYLIKIENVEVNYPYASTF